MASITREVTITAAPADVWDALRDFHAPHERLVKGFVVDSHPDGDRARIVTFANGVVAREILVTCDDEARRLVYSVVESPLGFSHYNAAAQVLPVADDGATRFVWTIDLLPDEAAARVADLMDYGLQAIRATLVSETPITRL
jgi:polyketide cyclase/dehydrase/lipid transport protein